MPGGKIVTREVVEHFGAVAIVAMDDDGRIPLVYQYRHPFGRRLWELPAGLLDVNGEAPAPDRRPGAARGGRPGRRRPGRCWSIWIPTPGFSDESVRVYLATGLTERRPTRGARRRGRHDLAVVSHRRGRAAGIQRGDRQFPCGGRDFSGVRGQRGYRGAAAGGCAVDRQADGVQRATGSLGDDAGAAAGRPAAGIPRSPDDRAGRRGQHVELLSPRPAPLLRPPHAARRRRLWPRSARTTSANS